MIRFIFILFFIFSVTALTAQSKIKKAVFIIVDGIPADVIKKLKLPHFAAITSKGGFAHATVGGEKNGYTQTPTISAVGYNSVLTGTWVNKHNVWGNDIKAPNYYYQNIFRLLKTQWPERKIGIFSSWLDNRTKLIGDGLAEAGNIHFDYHVDGLESDTINYPHDKNSNYMHRIDEKVADEAAEAIRTNAPDLSWVYLEYTDDMGHKYGDSPQFLKAIEYADEQVGRIWQATQYRQKNFNEDWLIIITTDHGRDAKTGKGHGGQSDRERAGWIATDAKDLNVHFKGNYSSIVDIMPTLARFMNINIPIEISREVDGVPLTGKLTFTGLSAVPKNDQILLEWKAINKKGKAKIWIAVTNNFKTGGTDEYHLVKEVPVKSQQAVINLKNYPSSFYKIVLEGPHNSLNRWIVVN